MSNGCKHEHRCFDCRDSYVCWSPECLGLAGEKLMLCPVCSFLVWVKATGNEEVGICQ